MTPTHYVPDTTPTLHDGSNQFSPLILADRLISLAQEADRAGYTASASRLIGLVYAVLDDEGPVSAAA